jgi:hypothetical protein
MTDEIFTASTIINLINQDAKFSFKYPDTAKY